MAHFSEYQVRRFRFIFNQYSEDAIGEADVETDPFAENAGSFEVENSTIWKLKFHYRLTAGELHLVIQRLGPEMSIEQVKAFLYTYDTSCTGALDFEDFLEFLADYQATLAQKRDKALTHYTSQLILAKSPDPHSKEPWAPGDPIAHSNSRVVVSRHFISAYPEANMYLEAQNLDDPEFFFTKQESLTNDIATSGFIEDMSILRRKIIFRVCAARNLRSCARFKRRVSKGIEYQSLDTLVKVECAGVSQETTAVLSSLKPEWDQDLTLNITTPPGEIQDVQQWVDRQVIQISLMDYEDSGIVPHTELLATAYIPLIRVLLSARKPIWVVLRLNTPDCVTRETDLPCIEVSIMDCTQERWAWAKVVDAYTYPEEVWFSKHPVKFTTDLKHVKKKPPSRGSKQSQYSRRRTSMAEEQEAKEETEGDEDSNFDVLTQYNSITKPLRVPFRRRTFNTLALDENNTIRPLTSFVRPITMHDECIVTPQQAAVAVARIPYQLPVVPHTEASRRLISLHVSAEEEERIGEGEITDSAATAGWPLRYAPHGLATENLFAQIAAPQTMLLARRGSLMEHAILLCGLMLGMGFQSYVAIGKVKRRPYVWVVTVNPVFDRDVSQPVDEFVPCNITFESTNNAHPPIVFRRTEFKKIKEAMEAQEVNKKFKIVHWDPLTGIAFDHPSRKGFLFDRLETLFNHQNIFYNVQNSDLLNRPYFSWNLDHLEHWIRFFPIPLQPSDPIKCFYSAPAYVMYSSLTTFDEKLDDKTLLTELIDYIQLYRRHSLYIATTTFHRAASRYLQSQLNRFEATHTNLLAETSQTHPIIHDSTTHHPQPFTSSTVMLTKGSVEFSGMGLMAKPKGRGLVTSGSKGSLFSLALLRDNSMLELGENLGAEVQEEMLGLLPDGHWWRGCVFHFKDSDVEAIMDQLVSSGLLDGSVPDVMYVCAARVFHHPLGMSSVWVGVGYISDINAKEHLKV